jgi:hypothetical protein
MAVISPSTVKLRPMTWGSMEGLWRGQIGRAVPGIFIGCSQVDLIIWVFLFGQEDGLAFGGQNIEDVVSPYGRLGDNLVRVTHQAEKIFEDHSLQLGPGWGG